MDTNIQSAIIHIFLSQPDEVRIKFLDDLRDLCDTLQKSHESNPDDLRNLLLGDTK